MRFNGKKFSDIILEKQSNSNDDNEKIKRKLVGYETDGTPIYELPEITVTAKKRKTKINFLFSDNGEVINVLIGN